MTRNAKIGLAVVIVLAVGAAGWFLWDIYGLTGPDRSAEIKQFIAKALFDPSDLKILSCRHVHPRGLSAAREQYPTLEIVDCKFLHKDPLGDMHENWHHVFLVDGKIIHMEGMTFDRAHGAYVDHRDLILGRVERGLKSKDFSDAPKAVEDKPATPDEKPATKEPAAKDQEAPKAKPDDTAGGKR